MSRIRRFQPDTSRMVRKTCSYYVMHITVAAAVAYAVTGDLAASLTLSLLEPTIQAFAYFFHEKAWARAGKTNPSRPSGAPAAGGRALACCPSAPRRDD